MKFIQQCKGKDITNVPASKLGNLFYCSTKYDGNYVQIHKVDGRVRFFTSGGKEFYLSNIAEELLENNPAVDFIIEAEYIANTNGKLGSRGECTCTTYRINYTKGIDNDCIYSTTPAFKVFDIIYYHNREFPRPSDLGEFASRLVYLEDLVLDTSNMEVIQHHGPFNLVRCQELTKQLVMVGYEGMMLKAPTHKYLSGKRVNDAVKLKGRLTADLKCINVIEGEGKYLGLIGSLVLVDNQGRVVNVGSGLNDADRQCRPTHFIDQIIEIEYEQILGTYIQPTFKCIRRDL